MREKILAYSIQYKGDWQSIAKALAEKTEIKPVKVNCSYVTIVDEAYPDKLKQLRFPPWILFYEGDFSLLNKESIGIVGSREIGDYGRECTLKICDAVKKQFVVVSGMAKGIDSCAHWACMDSQTVGVCGSGLDIHYPKCNESLYAQMKKNQLLISEYPPGTPVRKHHFPWRNRIIAALSDKLVIPQARIRSGTMITANHAAEMGKEVYCVPYPFDDADGEGCNELISNGAFILTSFDDLI